MIQNTIQPLIRRALCVASLAGTLALALPGISHAQQQTSRNYADAPFAVKAGVFLPTSRDVRSVATDAMFTVEGDYRVQSMPISNSYSLISLGYTGDADKFSMVPIEVSQMFRAPESRYYYGAGLGLYVTQLKSRDTDEKVKGLFGISATVGMNAAGPLFGELKYRWVARYDSKYVGGLQVFVGLHL